jgi:hypothetical protein
MGLFHPKVKVELSDTEVGIVGEQTIISRLAACGYTILTPIGGAKRYECEQSRNSSVRSVSF